MADETQSLLTVVVTSRIYICMTFAIYIFFPLCYITLVTLAAYLKSCIEEWSFLTQANVSLVTSLLISAGSLGIIFMALKCCWKSSVDYMKFMATITSLLLILQIIAAIYGGIQAADNNKYLQKSINSDMKAEFLKYDSSETVQKYFNGLQYEKECCGVYGGKDYKALQIKIPISCCTVTDNMGQYCDDPKLVYPQGCAAKLYNDIIKNIGILSYVTVGLIVLQIVLGCCILKMLIRS